MAAQPDVFAHCLEQAVEAAGPALERSLDDAVAALQFAESLGQPGAEREQSGLAWRELLQNKPAWCERYPARLQALLADSAPVAVRGMALNTAAAAGHPTHATPGPAAHLPLSLVDDADVSRSIASSRLTQQVLPAVEPLLAELDKLVSSVRGLSSVRPDMNPLQPEIFVRALQALMGEAPAEPALVALWIRHLAEPFGRELRLVYERLVNLLEMCNVQGASYRVVSQVSAQPARAAARAETGVFNREAAQQAAPAVDTGGGGWHAEGVFSTGPAPLSAAPEPVQYADLSNFEIREELFQEFLFNSNTPTAERPLAPAYYDNVEEELQALKSAPDSAAAPLVDLPDASRRVAAEATGSPHPPEQVDERSQLNQQVWGPYGRARERAMVRTQLRKEAQHVDQVLGLEVVRKLVNQVAQDPRLLVPVREAIVALEPSLLRLAMVDPRFFSDERHAGRRLLERVAQRSFKYNDAANPEFRMFLGHVTQAFKSLNEQDIDDLVPFVDAMATLEQQWTGLDTRETQQRDHILKTLRFAEDRQLLADQIATGLRQRSDLDKVHRLVLDFLLGPWALVLAHAKLIDTRNQVDPKGFGSVVPDLIWSVKRDVTLRRPSKLIAMIPGLLAQIHDGLTLIGQDPRESDAFFEALMKLHRPVLKLRRLKSRRDAEESGAMPLESDGPAGPDDLQDDLDHEQLYDPDDTESLDGNDTGDTLQDGAEALPWMGRDDLHAAGFEDTVQTDHGELLPIAEAPSAVEGLPQRLPTRKTADTAPTGSAAQPTDLPALASAEAEQLLQALRTGDWVDLYSRRQWLRAQLIWVSSKGTLFMFLSHGGQPHSMTKRSCERLLRERLLQPVDTHDVVEHALDAVASALAGGTERNARPDQGSQAARQRAATRTEPETA